MPSESTDRFLTISQVIQQRRTTKLLADPAAPVQLDQHSNLRIQLAVNEAVRIAGMAPFHHDRKHDGIAEPWRATILWPESCRHLAKALPGLVELPANNRLPFLLSGCAAAIIVTWLPETGMADPDKQRHVNDEHLAASAAFVQNLLLLLEAQELDSYWASGGLLASAAVMESVSIPATEKILAVVYVGLRDTNPAGLERLSGKHRTNRSDSSRWTRTPELPGPA